MGILSMLFKIGVDSTSFELGLKRARSAGEKFGASFKTAVGGKLAAVLSVSAMSAFVKNVIDAADKISDLSDQLNLTTDQIQRLQIVASESGVSFEKISSALAKFEQARLKATSGDEEAIKTFKNLGLTLDQLNDSQISTLEGAIRAAAIYRESGKSAETTAAMIDIYGLKLKSAGAALADYNTTSNRTIIQKDDIDVLAKANNLLDEQLRLVKALASPVIAEGITATANAIKGVTKPTQSYLDRLQLAARRAYRIQMLARMPDEALARIVQNQIAADRKSQFEGPNPPPIGTAEFEAVKVQPFSLGKTQDSLSRIGGFTGFQSAQDLVIKQAIEQTIQLKQINKNTGKSAQALSED